AFGMSGTNAHTVVEEYQEEESKAYTLFPYYILNFSAKTEESLEVQIRQMIQFIETGRLKEEDISQLSYTLLTGRHHWSHRCVLVVKDLEMAMSALKRELSNDKLPYLFKNKVNRDFSEQKVVMQYIVELLEKSRSLINDPVQYREILYGLADFYCQGYEIDWTLLFKGSVSQRIHLPTYPFSRERYWISETQKNDINATIEAAGSMIHPLLHENTSDLSEQRFTSAFTGKEFFLNDHQVKGEKVLPGVCYLEMARAAVEKASGQREAGTFVRLKNVVWAKSIVVNGPAQEVHIGLYGEESGQIKFEVYTESDNKEELIVHSQGVAEVKTKEEIPSLDIEDLRSKMNQGTLSADSCYQTFKEMGIEYGKGHRGIREIYWREDQLLAKLSLPTSVQDTQNEYVLHPSLMDSALQSSIGLMLKSRMLPSGCEVPIKPSLPFALESLEIFGSCGSEMYAWVRYSVDSTPSDKVQKLDIDLCDEQGNVLVKLRRFTSRVLEEENGVYNVEDSIGTLLAIPAWKERAVLSSATQQEYAKHLVLLCELPGVKANELQSLVHGSHCENLKTEQNQIESRFIDYSVHCFEMIRELLEKKPQGKVLIQILLFDTREQSLFAGLSGLLKTTSLESPNIVGQIIQVSPQEKIVGLATKLKENQNTPYNAIIRYNGKKRCVLSWEELKKTELKFEVAINEQGVYLITGGLGGLGVLFTREILKQAKNAKIILTGRSELSAKKKVVLDKLKALGVSIDYQKVDISHLEQVKSLIEYIQGKYTKLNGIIHSAGVIADNFILKKRSEEFSQVLLPKVAGTVNMDKATQCIELDFFVLFSSSVGVTGNIGQADYATANAFMDRFAIYRNQLVDSNERQGKTLSINWPLWREGGMGVDTSSEVMMKKTTGMVPMQTETGIQAFNQSLNSNNSQVLVVEGLVSRIRKVLFSHPAPQKESPVSQETTLGSIDTEGLLTKIQSLLIKNVSKTLKLNLQDIDLEGELNEYGFDSITLTDFANRLNEKYHLELAPTLFFEYSTIGTLAEYLAREHKSVFVEQFCEGAVAQTSREAGEEKEEPTSTLRRRRSLFVRPQLVADGETGVDPIAIVGMSGCFPEAENLNQFWKNLIEEKDCISEIPKERWDWKALYGDPHQEVNKCNIKWGGFIKNIYEFDPLFFGISPREAELMDPQQRLLMTYVYLAIEDAGYSTSALSGSNTGIFVGTGSSGYSGILEKAGIAIEGYTSTGMVPSVGPNRMSYFLNFHGPSEPIETACSSSLVAIHRALQAMEGGSCNAAIVGGVNTIVTSDAHISFNKAGMLCEDGRCKTFSSQANGYVRGEGVGMLFLKKLSQAEADGDHIYGLIRGSAENHGGRANSLTSPNPKAQAELLKAAYKKSGLDPKTISYIEAHGTGTELGDPIEINGLKTAFRELYQEFGYDAASVANCGIGSVKSNIGHLELAAGVAGVIKVLLQFKHKRLVSTLHCKELNSYIDLENTPFYILRESRDWNGLKDESGREIPRRAGVSSFGFGGANAHVVLEEYCTHRNEVHSTIEIQPEGPVIIPLSARTKEQLKQRASDLFEFLQVSSFVDVQSLAYTLQVGREEMDERLGFIVTSIEKLEKKLQAYLAGDQEIEEFYQGDVKRNKDTLGVFTVNEELQEVIEKWIRRRKLTCILDLWVKGLAFDWNKLNSENKPKRISLPTYPFARERYWISETKSNGIITPPGASVSVIHPLLHENTSDLSGQRFTSTFTGKEFFLTDYQVKGEKILPGVGYLEMARAAVEKAAGERDEGTSICFKKIVWYQPIVVNDTAKRVHIGLYEEESDHVQYEVYTEFVNKDEEIIHFQGVAEVKKKDEIPALDIQDLQSQMNQGILNGDSCYQAFKEMGMGYGEGHQGIREIYQGSNQLLAKIKLPSSVQGTESEYVLHPSLMDSALQSSIGFVLKSGTQSNESEVTPGNGRWPLRLLFPSALEFLEILGSCTTQMYAWVRYTDIGSKKSDKVQKHDIDLCDEQGNVCVKMRGLTLQELEITPNNDKTVEL
ncbi:MAG: SDR family NAD(P)-dependent oxidoreductase, partial [Gammaproteobacteria bacterium]|nr:SDR family NAD(P)-dependent oxidoreductase [Gammaproteobacteria bacterium]